MIKPSYTVWGYEIVDGAVMLTEQFATTETIGNARQRAYDLAGSNRGNHFAAVKPDGSIDVVWLAECVERRS